MWVLHQVQDHIYNVQKCILHNVRAGTYFDADQKWCTEMHSGFIYEPQNLWRQRYARAACQQMETFDNTLKGFRPIVGLF
jgi:hypothetical protein